MDPEGIADLPSTRGPLLVGPIGLSKEKPPPPAPYTEPNRLAAYLPALKEWGGNPLLL